MDGLILLLKALLVGKGCWKGVGIPPPFLSLAFYHVVTQEGGPATCGGAPQSEHSPVSRTETDTSAVHTSLTL